jgi:hypothetical protein
MYQRLGLGTLVPYVCTVYTRTSTYPSTVYGKSLLTTMMQRICFTAYL